MKLENRDELINKVNEALNVLHSIYPQFDPNSEHNKETGRRIADTWIEICKGYMPEDFEFTKFKSDGNGQPIVLKNIEFNSFCTHHFLPFSGKISIGYLPNKEICGVSKLARVVEYLASKPQIQEILGREIAEYLAKKMDPYYILVKVEAQHTCISCRGVKSKNSTMTTFYEVSKVSRELSAEAFGVLSEMFRNE